MKITNKTLTNFNQSAVEITDWNNVARKGWFIKIDNESKYLLKILKY